MFTQFAIVIFNVYVRLGLGLIVHLNYTISIQQFSRNNKSICCVKSFPDSVKNPELYSIWVKNVNKGGPAKFVPGKDSCICSEHFSADTFEEDGCGRKAVLKPYAVPTIFKQLAEVGAVPCSYVIYIYYIQ